jgi:hypothetical protein
MLVPSAIFVKLLISRCHICKSIRSISVEFSSSHGGEYEAQNLLSFISADLSPIVALCRDVLSSEFQLVVLICVYRYFAPDSIYKGCKSVWTDGWTDRHLRTRHMS